MLTRNAAGSADRVAQHVEVLVNEGTWLVLLLVAVAVGVLAVLALIALAVSFVVPVDLSIAVLAVLTGGIVEYMLLYGGPLPLGSDRSTLAVQLGAGIAWITGVLVAGAVLGLGPVFVGAVLAALGVTRWVLTRLASRASRQQKAREAWRARPEFEPLAGGAEPEPGTPEEAMTRYLAAWRERDFGAMSEWTHSWTRNREAQIPKRLEELYGLRDLTDFSIVKVRDTAAAMTEVTATLTFASGDPSVTMTANVIFGAGNHPKVRGTGGGRWGVDEESALHPWRHSLAPRSSLESP